MSGGSWAPCDAPVAVDDRYMAAGGLGESGESEVAAGGMTEPPPAPQVALAIRDVAGGLGLPCSDDGDDSDSDVDMGSSPLVDRKGGGLRGLGSGRVGPLVEPVVLFPAVPVVAAAVGRHVREGTVPDSVDGGDSDFNKDREDAGGKDFDEDPACGGGSRAGGCVCSCEAELGHLNR